MQVMQSPSELSLKKQKTKEDYSRNVKKLKYKLDKISGEIQLYEKKIKRLQNTSNDQVIAMKISKFCKERKFTPEMLFRFADSKCQKIVTRTQFRNTLISIGLKLSQQQMTRLQYLLDEDIKGDISMLDYSKYLHAFGLKQQFRTDDPFVKDTLQKIDFNKILDIAKDDVSKQKKKQGRRILLSYEQFLKYCHKNFPEFSDKQLGVIFNKLSRDNVIDLEDLIEYIKNLRDQQQRINRKNNKGKQKKKKDEQNLGEEEMKQQEQIIDITLLKGKIMAILKSHPQNQQNFHSSEFKRVQKIYNLEKGTMVDIFRQMDTKMVGSIGYNEIIIYYVDKQTYRPNNDLNVKYAFILMGKKLQSKGEKPQSLIEAFSKSQSQITFEEFKKLCLLQFQLKQDLSKKLYQLMLNSVGGRSKDNNVNTKFLISLMKFSRKGIKNNFRPYIQEKFKSCMYKKMYETICTNGLVTFKLCRSIVDQLSKVQEGSKKWDDPQFGPVNQDSTGIDSIGQNVSNPNIRWLRRPNLNEFYIPNSSNKDKIYKTTSLCSNEVFYKSLDALVKYNPQVMNRQLSQIVKQNKKVEQVELLKLFQGLHPLVFQQFQVWGIYVIQFFVKNKWIYVMVDDKIPCDENNKPLFATSVKGTGIYVSLIQKAYAKLKGSYQKIYQFPSLKKYINELSGLLPYEINLTDSQNDGETRKLWQRVFSQSNMTSQLQEVQKQKQKKFTYQKLFLVNQSLFDIKARQDQKSGLKTDFPIQIYFSTELKQQNSQNQTHKLTFLNSLYELNEQNKWNNNWHIDSKKWKQNSGQIKSEINKWDSSNQNMKIYKNGEFKTSVIDFQLLSKMFNSLLVMKRILFDEDDKTIVLRKELEFQKNFSCHYKISSTNQSKKVKLIVLLNKIRAPTDTKISIQLRNENVVKGQQDKNIPQTFIMKGDFGSYCFQIPTEEKDLQIKVINFDPQEQYIYQLTFYFDHPRYSLKQRDRHLLFRFVSVYEERSKLDFDILTEQEKKYFYQNYFPNAGRKGFLCC